MYRAKIYLNLDAGCIPSRVTDALGDEAAERQRRREANAA
ncbi:hypothetical protein SAMN05216277_102325 [Halolamina pelagica]|uniref:Uncharacterized protein n=1 Tax=Halolamina pelagica TaxID=699431 RepID=A0A1I5P4T5_9EURY|nr:hypothetical protein SAMN05216277_102325 [Halolamina pelagica]